MMKIKYLAGMLVLLCSLPCFAGEQGSVLVASELRQEPYLDATSLTTLPVNSAVSVVKRQGGWLQVVAGDRQGWLKMTSVRLSAASADGKSGDKDVNTLFNLARSGRSGNTGVTVTSGVRGLSAEELKNASPSPEAVKKLDTFPKGRKEAESFAIANKLQYQQIEYIAEPNALVESTKSFFGGSRK